MRHCSRANWRHLISTSTRWAASLLCVALLACDRPTGEDAEDEAQEETFSPVPVEAEQAARRSLRRTVLGTTTLRSAVEVSVTTETAGEVVSLEVEEGDVVERGQQLARIENPDAQIALDEARQAVSRYEREVAALQPLFEQGYLARRTYDEATFQLETARTSLRRAQRAGGAQTLRAPAAGVVVRRYVDVGELVVPNAGVVDIADVTRLEAVIAVPERELVRLREGQRSEVVVGALGDAAVGGVVERLDPVVDPQTGTIRAYVALDAHTTEDGADLRPGMFAEVRVVTDVREGALAVPKRALVREAGLVFVYVIGDAEAWPEAEGSDEEESPFAHLTPYEVERVEVELGYEDRDVVEVRSGIDEDARVVVIGQSGLDPSAIVVVPSEAEPSEGGAPPASPGAGATDE